MDHYGKAGGDVHSVPAVISPQNDLEPPDGGLQAWLVVFGAMCSTFTTFGYVNAWGVFQEYYQRSVLSHSSPSDIAWIGSIQYALVFLPGLPVGRLFDLGYFRSVFIPASALLILATFLIPECKEYWQFLLCQGFATGLACGTFFGPVTAILAMWFKKRRGFALGLFATGSSIGGTVIPIVVRSLIPKVGFAWAVRIVGFILFAGLTAANLTLKRRIPPVPSSEGVFNLRMFKQFKSPAFTIYCISTFFVYLGFYTLLTYVSATATSIGVSESFSFYLVSIANASGGIGRIGAGLFADRFGAMNVLIPFTALTGVMTCVWPFTRSTGGLIAVTVIYGFSSGPYGSLVSVPVIETGEPGDTNRDLGRRIGLLMTFLASGGLLGPPISGLIFRSRGIEAMGIYAGTLRRAALQLSADCISLKPGCMIILGVVIMCIPRFLVLSARRKRGRMTGWILSKV
ncbi:major facilitator superfamily domain-containing protein [Lentinula edodes]|uniref:major facilitator superfamily domain-containing protein n=1 Tax=Lentinula edodes TaxID=5353 RepID=UPI001E8DD712|nr:major facilitator superfamily domain-containing protein [Lentinula edodes]KAH7876449.1 major facilitator superfamily domain-containing protein [Lentinula edodes]